MPNDYILGNLKTSTREGNKASEIFDTIHFKDNSNAIKNIAQRKIEMQVKTVR